MPIYEYECEECGRTFEIIENITADKEQKKRCSFCYGVLRKIVSPPTLLKNAGVYLYDRRTGKDLIHDR